MKEKINIKTDDIKIKLYAGLVCPRRSLDYKLLEKYFKKNQCEIVINPEEATHIIIITCGFIDRNISESIELINTAKQYKKEIIVGGCLEDIAENILKENFKGNTFTTKNINKIDDFFPEFSHKFETISDANSIHDYHEIDTLIGKRKKIIEKHFSEKTECFPVLKNFVIRIGYGCNCKCTYCSHRNAIGKYRSKKIKDCLYEYKKGINLGYEYFRITSMDTGCYGIDIKSSFPDLIKEFINISDKSKFILEDINPVWINKYSKEIIKLAENKKIKSIQTPFQSGSPNILKKMKRWNKTDNFLKIINKIKNADPEIHLSTEILIGFPTEEEADFELTLALLKNAGFDFTYIYPYYENNFIDSAAIFPKISKEIINKRLNKIMEFCEKHKISYSLMMNI